MADADLTGLQDFQVGCQGLEEDVGNLEEWLAWAPTEGFDIDGLICGADEDHIAETQVDHGEGLCSEFAQHGLLVNDSSSTSSNNNTNSSDISNRNPQPESNCQAQEGVKTSCEIPDSKRLLRLVKNRDAAAQSRKRKKSYIQDLESKCRMLENYSNQLQQSVAFTCTENMVLRDELLRCKRQKGGNDVAEPAVPKDSLPSESLSHLTTVAVNGRHVGIHCLDWLLATMILLLFKGAVNLSSTNGPRHTKNGYQSSTFRVFINLNLKRRVFESFPGTRCRAFSSCRHRYWKLNNVSLNFQCVI
ncbi:bZIP transcription factor 50 [Cryptomeria japonica]|uniref:bZIP transcription factor 50 n=1 Tax=Cryptomeria japonica TaxID=3369 RepID=UPI0027DAA203|nr:bZIP transcription factor 50 [Cryptomeria japonica]